MKNKIHGLLLAATLGVSASVLGLAGCQSSKGGTTTVQHVDSENVKHIKGALDKDPTYRFPDITVTSLNGQVQLGGFAANEAQKERAGQIAEQVTGRSIDNRIDVRQ